jgi:glucose/mannose-6-phosphate isomerase
VYGASTALGAVAYRWKCQFNENAKTLAHWGAFPEVSHNETVGWTDGAAAGRTVVVLLREPDEPDERRQRIEATREVAFAGAAAVEEVVARGEGRLSRLLSLVLLGDFTSVYLALLRGVDPTPVPVIDEVKRRLSGTPH